MIKILWVDDNLDQDLTDKRQALYMEDDFEPHFARDASAAYYRLRDEAFDVVIFDLRLPPGADDMWNSSISNGFWKYGASLLRFVREDHNKDFSKQKEARLGVFTIESETENLELFAPPISLPRENFRKKVDLAYEEDFIEFVRSIAQSAPNHAYTHE